MCLNVNYIVTQLWYPKFYVNENWNAKITVQNVIRCCVKPGTQDSTVKLSNSKILRTS